MTAVVIRGDARRLPLPDASVDLVVTSPPYFGLRSYTDGGRHYDGQIGAEPTPAAYIDALLDCTAEWVRVLKPEGSIFVNLGDKYGDRSGSKGTGTGTGRGPQAGRLSQTRGPSEKSLLLLPERYRVACADRLGLIIREALIWFKPNGMPESVTDRCRRSHEDWVHLTKQPRYYSAVDVIREAHTGQVVPGRRHAGAAFGEIRTGGDGSRHTDGNPLGKLPGSVWEIPTEPLTVPDHLGVDHHAAFPVEWPRRLILGWSPPGICTACSQGRRPVAVVGPYLPTGHHRTRNNAEQRRIPGAGRNPLSRHGEAATTLRSTAARDIYGYVCACTPYVDHPGTGTPTGRQAHSPGVRGNHPQGDYGRKQAGEYERVGPWREYHLDRWAPPPTRPAVVLDPFGGTGSTALAASVLGRVGITVDRSGDYCRIAAWRTTDPGERARAARTPKPPVELEGQLDLFGE